MKKFVAVLLPIILIGSLAMGFTASAACPVADPEARWDATPRNQLPELADRQWFFGAGVCFHILPQQGGRAHPTGSVVMRSTPAGREDDDRANYLVTVPARLHGVQQVVRSIGNAYQAWTMYCRTDSWIHVEWLGTNWRGYIHERHLQRISP